MKRTLWIIAVVFCLFLSGCSWMDGNYHYVAPHQVPADIENDGIVMASSYAEIRSALEKIVTSGKKNDVIYIKNIDETAIESEMDRARSYIMTVFPIGAYAVEELTFEVGTSGGVPAVAVEVTYLHSRSEIQRIETVSSMEDVLALTEQALENTETDLVMMVDRYQSTDIVQHIQNYADLYPERIMEVPKVSIGMYPENGNRRVIELKFTYQNARELLRQMRSQVKPVFEAAALYVTEDGDDVQKYTQLYAFLMERFDYQFSTSITPTYSLLRHGVGDSRTFALVYAAMCRSVDLDCIIVKGSRDGEPWYWNIICDNGNYSHLDLLQCNESGEFLPMSDDQMNGYVWDYSGYPECPALSAEDTDEPAPSEETEPDSDQSVE